MIRSDMYSGRSRDAVVSLPVPGEEARQHGDRVLQAICRMIDEHDGAISFEQYMQAALYLPQLGYYRCGTRKFGMGGDFTTAPEVSPIFGRCLGRFVEQVPVASAVLEVGAGSGKLAVNIMQALMTSGDDYRYFILEVSEELRDRQKTTISESLPEALEHVSWLDDFPADFDGVVIANELLDAMPVRRFHLVADRIHEQHVVCHKHVLASKDIESHDVRLLNRVKEVTADHAGNRPGEYLSEINFMAEDWVRTLSASLGSAVLLIIDYGYPRSAYYHPQRNSGTVMCHYQHRAHPDPLILPGIQDITAHIDFTAIADAGLEGGTTVAGFTTQAHFLMNLGILEEIDPDTHESSEHTQLAGEIKRLTLPGEMGEQFKVMALSKDVDDTIPGFGMYDMRHLL